MQTRHKASELMEVVYRESLLPKENPTLRTCARWFHVDGMLKSRVCTYLLCGDGGCHKRHKLEAEVAFGILVVLDPGAHHPTHPACEKLSSCTIIESATLSISTRQNVVILPNDWAFGLWKE